MNAEAAEPIDGGFGTWTATFVVVSSMIGVGILTTSGLTVLRLGSNQLMLILWGVGGVVALCGALTLAELSSSLPRSGGDYVIVREAYGPLFGFLAGWVSFQFGFSAPIAAAASAGWSYLLAPLALATETSDWARPAFASLTILGFALVHGSGQGRSSRLQGLGTILELTFLAAFVVAGLISASLGHGRLANLEDRPPIEPRTVVTMFLALVYVAYGYTGWNAASYLAGEVRDAPRRLPRAIAVGTLLVTALYLALNLVYALALPAREIRQIAEQGGTAAVEPIARLAATRLFGEAWGNRLSVGMGLIFLATVSAFLLTGPRVMVAMARAGQFPAMVGRISPVTGTPRIATLLQAGWALVLLWTGSFEAIVLYSGVGLAIASLFTVAAVYVMRVRQPNLPRPFQVPGYPWTPAVYLVASGALIAAMFAEETAVALFSLLSILSGLPVYFLMQLRPKMRRT